MESATRHSAVSDQRSGYVTRTYPVILDRWQILNDLARCAARLLYMSISPGDVFTIVNRQFYKELPCDHESGCRRAFRRLTEVGLCHVVGSAKGRRGGTIYRLADATEVYLNRGLTRHVESPQQLLPFAIETAEEQDLGGGIIRLFDPNQCANSGALECAESGASECAKSGALTQQEGTARTEKSGQLQHSTQRRIEQPQSVASGGVAATEATTWDRDSDQLAVPSQRRSDDFGTRGAMRAPHAVLISSKEEIYNYNSNSKPNPNQTQSALGSASALAGDSSLSDWADAVDAETMRRSRDKIRELQSAVRSAEAAAGITQQDSRRMHRYLLTDWLRAISTHALSRQDVDELVDDLRAIDTWRIAPGALVNQRLQDLLFQRCKIRGGYRRKAK